MRKSITLLLFLLLFTGVVKAQISRGEWSYGPVITTTNNFYGNLAQTLIFGNIPFLASDSEAFMLNNRWWIPSSWNKYTIMQKVETPMGKMSAKWWDWKLKNYSVGYHIGYMPKSFPVGFDFQVDYERKGMELKLSGANNYTSYSKQMVTPTMLLKIRLGDYASNRLNPIVEMGGSYDYAFSCKGDFTDINSINNGFSGIIGIGFVNTETHLSVILRYEHDFYDYFNQKFTPDGTLCPYKDCKTAFSCLSVAFIIGF